MKAAAMPGGTATSCEAALRDFCAAACAMLDEGLALVMADEDPRGPHKARVALRRLTTCLDAFAPLMRQKPLAIIRRRAKAMFRALGQLRDSDVYTIDRAAQPGHAGRLRQNRRWRKMLRESLGKGRALRFSQKLLADIAPGAGLLRQGRKARALRAAPVAGFADGFMQMLWQESTGFGPSVAALSAERRHDFRKTLKALRYACEHFVDYLPLPGMPGFLDRLRPLQDALGILNDFDVALEFEGRGPPPVLPAREAQALAEAEALWAGLVLTGAPWAAYETRLP